jgi:hypothetical protein
MRRGGHRVSDSSEVSVTNVQFFQNIAIVTMLLLFIGIQKAWDGDLHDLRMFPAQDNKLGK